MAFDTEIRGHHFTMDAKKEAGGNDQGPTPKEIYLSAIIGCTGMDVVSLLKKMRVEFTNVELDCDGELTEQGPPKTFKKVEITYKVEGPSVDPEKVKKSVEMSMTKYCGVSAMVVKACPIFYKIMVNGAVTSEGQAHF